jgi:hypothetical protein
MSAGIRIFAASVVVSAMVARCQTGRALGCERNGAELLHLVHDGLEILEADAIGEIRSRGGVASVA